jgi:hypothetical protein
VSSYISKQLNNEYNDINYEILKKMSRENREEQVKGQQVTANAYQGNHSDFNSNKTSLRQALYNEILEGVHAIA